MKRIILLAFTALALAQSAPAQGTNPLRIVCPPDRTNWVCSPTSSAVVTYPSPTVTDNCTGTPTLTCTPPAGAVFTLGTTMVTCRATNACGESMVCGFKITLAHDTIPPVIQCPTNRMVWTCNTSEVVNYTVSATDACDPNVAVVCTPPSGTAFPLGTTTVTCMATDRCTNQASCTFQVTVAPFTIYGGLYHRPLGSAALNTNAVGQLEVSGLGASGQDGVRIELGESRGLVWRMKPPAGSPDGDLEVQVRGRTDAGTEIPLRRLRYQSKGERLTVTPEGGSYELKLMHRGQVVFRQGGRTGAVEIPECHHVSHEHCSGEPFEDFLPSWHLPWCIDFLTIECQWDTDSGPVVADAMVLTPEDPLPPFASISAIQILGRNLPGISLFSERLLMFGDVQRQSQPHRALGQALLVAENNALTIANLGASGQDGVRIDLGNRSGLRWRMKNPAGTPEGDMDIDIIGRTSVGTEVPVRRISHHYRDGRHSVTPGTGSYEWKLLLRGQVVFRQGGQTGDIDIPECHHVETEHCVGEPFAGWNPYLPYCFNVLTVECDWDTPAGPMRADTLVLTPEDPLPPLTAVAAVRILGRNLRDLPALTLLEERRLTFGGSELQLACPPNLTVPTCSTNPMLATFLPPLATGGNCTAPPVVTCVPPSGSLFLPGATTVVCTVTNVCGERDACTFIVTVIPDTVPPVVVCPTNIVVQAQDALGVVVTWPNPEATDNLMANPQVSCLPPAGTVFPIGRTTVICEARDECDHRSRCSFAVTVTRGPGLPGTDRTGDGLSDIWQARFGANGLAPEEDTDGDGHTNFEEQVAGTDPFDSASRAEQRDLGKYNRMFEMYVKGVVGKLYQIQVAPELGKPWTDFGPIIVGTGAVIEIRISLDDPSLPPSFEMQGLLRFSVSDVDADGDGVTAWEESIIGTSDLTPDTHGNPGGDYQAAQDWIARHR